MESGYYPAGAQFDSNAPWNQHDPNYIKCEACDGKGYHWHAYDIKNDSEVECTREAWLCLPETEEEAMALGQRYIQGDVESCEACEGRGEIDEDVYWADYEGIDSYDD